MRVLKKMGRLVFTVILFASMINASVYASEGSKDGVKVSITADKGQYSAGEDIAVNITVENTNSFEIRNVSIESIIPEGLEINDNSGIPDSIAAINAGEKYSFELILRQTKTESPGDGGEPNSESGMPDEPDQSFGGEEDKNNTDKENLNEKNDKDKGNYGDSTETSVKTGDQLSLFGMIALALASAAVLSILLFVKKKNGLFILILGIVGSVSMVGSEAINAEASSKVIQGNISVSELINVEDSQFELQVNVKYEYVNIQDEYDKPEISIEQEDFTTEESGASLSGTYTGNVTGITYENIPEDEEYGDIANGDVKFADNQWNLDIDDLEIGANNITITAVDAAGNKAEVSIQIIVEGMYRYSQEDIITDENTGISYVKGVILVFFEDDVDSDGIKDIVNSVSGKIIGKDASINEVVIRVPETDYYEMKDVVNRLEATEGVVTAMTDLAGHYSDSELSQEELEAFYPADGATDYSGRASWYYEIGASILDLYQKNDIDVGVVDSGFDFQHEDLQLIDLSNIRSENNDHGTRVCGRIGAKHNDIGINGILRNCNIYCYDWKPEEYQREYMNPSSTVIYGLVNCVENCAKVINYSLGIDPKSPDLTEENINDYAKNISKWIYILRKLNYDFLVVQAAGNGHWVEDGEDNWINTGGRDAINAGLFTAINENNCYVGDGVSTQEILDSVIVVANAEKKEEVKEEGYQLYYTSNGGERVDIAAPGTEIFSAVVNGYNYDSGTSFAAPMVTAAAAGIWAMDNSLSAAQVKDIILKTADPIVSANPDAPNAADNGRESYTLLNIADAVNYLLDEMTGTVSGQVLQENLEPLSDVTIEVYDENSEMALLEDTDENGAFSFDLVEGTYKVWFKKSGYESTEMSVEVLRDGIELDPVIMALDAVDEEKEYLDELEIIEYDQYTGNLADSFVYKIGAHEFSRGNVDIDGNVYDHGLEGWIARWDGIAEKSWAYSVFDLNKEYSEINGKCVLISSRNTYDFDTTLEFWGDGSLLQSYHLTPEAIPFDITLDVTDIDHLKVYFYDNEAVAGGTSFGLTGMELRK